MINYTKRNKMLETKALAHNKEFKGELDSNKRLVNKFETALTGEGFLAWPPNLDKPKLKKVNGAEVTDGFVISMCLPKDAESTKQLIKLHDAMFIAAHGRSKTAKRAIKDGDSLYQTRIEDAEDSASEGSPEQLEAIARVEAFYGVFKGHIYFNAKTLYNTYYTTEDGYATDITLESVGKKAASIGADVVNGKFVAIPGDRFSHGNIVRTEIVMMPYNRPDNKGLTFGLRMIQLLAEGVKHGTSSGGSSSSFGDTAGFDEVPLPPPVNEALPERIAFG